MLVHARMLGVVVLFVLLAVPALAETPSGRQTFFEQGRKATQSIATAIHGSKKVQGLKGDSRVAVAPFQVLSQSKMPDVVSQILQQMIVTAFAQGESERLTQVDPLVLKTAMDKLALTNEALADPNNWKTLGDAVNLKYLMVGSLTILPGEKGTSICINARLVEIATGAILAASDASFTFNE